MSTSTGSLKNNYRLLHDCRFRLLLAEMLTDSENEKVKHRIEKWANDQGINTVSKQLARNKKASSVDKA